MLREGLPCLSALKTQNVCLEAMLSTAGRTHAADKALNILPVFPHLCVLLRLS